MVLNEETVEVIDNHIEKYSPDSCPVCDQGDWSKEDHLGAICAQHDRGVNLYKTLQVVQLVCNHCGYVLLFDATRIGKQGVEVEMKLKARR